MKSKFQIIDNKFSSSYDAVEEELKSSTVGLVTLEQMREKRDILVKEREKQIAAALPGERLVLIWRTCAFLCRSCDLLLPFLPFSLSLLPVSFPLIKYLCRPKVAKRSASPSARKEVLVCSHSTWKMKTKTERTSRIMKTSVRVSYGNEPYQLSLSLSLSLSPPSLSLSL